MLLWWLVHQHLSLGCLVLVLVFWVIKWQLLVSRTKIISLIWSHMSSCLESRPYNKHMSYIFNLILIHSHICLPMWTGCIESTVIDQNALLHFLPKLLTSGRHVTHNLGYVITYLIVVVIFVIVFFRHFDMFDSWFSG